MVITMIPIFLDGPPGLHDPRYRNSGFQEALQRTNVTGLGVT